MKEPKLQKTPNTIHEEYYPIPICKRLFDIIFAALFLVLLSPIFIIFLPLLFIEHVLDKKPHTPLYYKEKRVSEGRIFYLIKFNIFKQAVIDDMRARGEFIHTKDLEHNGGITRIGWILKQIYMDELPQLINVLKGEMSLVGPRPLNLEVYESTARGRLATQGYIRAGMTGNYQSRKNSFNYSNAELDSEYYNYYISEPGYKIVLFDIKILLRTIIVILRAKGV